MSTADNNAISEVLNQVPATLRALVNERDKLAAELSEYQRADKAAEVVEVMDRKGLSDPTITFRQKVASVLESGKNLDMMKEAMEMSSTGLSQFSVSGDSDSAGSATAFEDFILDGSL